MVDTQRVHNTWLHKADFSAEGWAKLPIFWKMKLGQLKFTQVPIVFVSWDK